MLAESMGVSQDPSVMGEGFQSGVLESLFDAEVMFCREMAGSQDLL